VVLKKPSQIFESNRQEKSTEPPNLFESIDRFRGSLENVDQISTQIQELSEELSQKVSKTELENTLLSHLLVLEENFDHIQKQIKGINKNDIRQFKESVSDIGQVVDNLIHTELPKYKKQVTGSELRIEKRLDTFTETFDSNFFILENQLVEKMEICLQRIEDIFGELRYDEQIAEHSKVLEELKESTFKLSSDVEIVERYISNRHSDVIDLREELLRKIELLPIEDLAERVNQIAESYSKIGEEITLSEGLLNEPPETNNSDPLTPLDQNFVTLDQLSSHYKLFLARIQQQLSAVGGGGETQLKYLDDIVGIATNASAYDSKFLKYDHSIGKFEFVTVSGGGSVDYASVAGIATYASSAGIATYADTAGIVTYSSTAGISTVSEGLTGSPDISVGIITASGNVFIAGTVGIGTDNPITNSAFEVVSGSYKFGFLGVSSDFSAFGSDTGVIYISDVDNPFDNSGLVNVGDGQGIVISNHRATFMNDDGLYRFGPVENLVWDIYPAYLNQTFDAFYIGSNVFLASVDERAYISAPDGIIFGGYGNVGLGTTTPSSKLTVVGDTLVTGIVTSGISIPTQLRTRSVAERTTLTNGNTVSLSFDAGGGNVAICTNPAGDITLNVIGVPTDSSFDNHSISFSVIITQTGTARTCTAVNLNGVSRLIHWSGKSLSQAISGVTTSNGYDIFTFTGINTVGSASTTANYVVLGSVNGGFAV
jgi:uncharacterized protein Yka (UPF0111/DUF47 family)